MIFGYIRAVGDAVDRTRRRVNEATDAGFLGGDDRRLEGVEVDGRAELLIKLEACVVGNASKIDDLVLAFQRCRELLCIADVAGNDFQPGIILGQKPVAKKHDVIDGDLVPGIQQLRG